MGLNASGATGDRFATMTFSHSTSWAGDPARAFDADRVLELLPCLRSLARRLVQDEAEAEDVARDALDRVARAGRPVDDPRRFGLGVVRNLALQRRRKDARRRHHEAARAAESAAEGDAPPADRIVERVELMGVVLEEIGKLTEAQSRVIGLRYLDELSVAEIAEREGSTPSTVRSHLSRGLQAVRERLDDRFGERAAWSSILVPWAFDPASLPGDAATDAGGSTGLDAAQGAARATAGAFGGALATMTVLKTSLLVGALAAAGTWLALSDRGADTITPTLAGASDAASNDGVVRDTTRRGVEPPTLETTTNAGARTPGAADATDSSESAAPAATFPVEGRVVSATTGRGLLGVEVEIHPLAETHRGATWRAQTDEEGRFRVEDVVASATDVLVVYRDQEHGPALEAEASPPIAFPFESDLVLDLHPAIRFDYRGAPVPKDAVVRALPDSGSTWYATVGAMYSRVRPGRHPWVRYDRALASDLPGIRLEVADEHLVGYAPVPEGEDRFRDPLPVTFVECGAIELRVRRDELAGINAARLFRVDDENAPPLSLWFQRKDQDGALAATARHLEPGAYRWAVKLGDVEREGSVTVRPQETAVVELEDFDWSGRRATVLIDASSVPDADVKEWTVRAADGSSPDRTLLAKLERAGAEGSGLWHATVDDLPPGEWLMFMSVPNGLRVEPQMVRVDLDGVAGPMVVRAAAASRTIDLRVVDAESGKPLTGASVWSFSGIEGDTLSGGRGGVFEDVEVSGDTTTSFFASVDGYRLQQIDFVPGETSEETLEFRLAKGWASRVVVFEMSAQVFASGVSVHVDGELRGRTGDDGALWLEGDGPPERVEVARGSDEIEVVFDPFESGAARSGMTPGYIFAVRHR